MYLHGEKINQHTPPLSINVHSGHNFPLYPWGQHRSLTLCPEELLCMEHLSEPFVILVDSENGCSGSVGDSVRQIPLPLAAMLYSRGPTHF